jgi:tetratricopeptide (TPR) repeat protein
MRLKCFSSWLFFFISLNIISQEMKEGFNYLETGKYKKAEFFFKEVLKTYPKNKTARLCYGRAVGLLGESEKAIQLFTSLLQDYPSDFEVKLNYAESLLWNKNFLKAKKYYEKLIKENNTNFSALLGYANTLSNLKEFTHALIYADKALIVLPENQNALVSKKYIRLGLANEKVSNQKYDEAEKILKENFTSFKDDKETLLNLANLYLISKQINKAIDVYNLIGEDPENNLTSLHGISLAHHLNGDDKTALSFSKKAYESLDNTTSEKLKNQTTERYIQALIWNKKYALADAAISKLLNNNKNPKNWMLALSATLNIYKSNFKKSLEYYNLILKKDSTSFEGNLGKANTLKASGDFNNAYKSAENTLIYHENQRDAMNFIKELDLSFTPFVETKVSYSYDNGNNEANVYNVNSEIPFSTKFKILANYQYRTTSNNVTNLKAVSNNLLLGASYQLSNNLTLKGSLGVVSSDSETKKYNQLLSDISIHMKPFKLQNLELGYKRDIQNFNAELLDREIVQNNLILNYSVNTNFNLGWFTQYYYTFQSDENTRNLLFTSLYYQLLEKPSLKVGINYQNISFKNQVPTIYFSPNKFNALELFIDLVKDESAAKNKELFYGLTAAAGFQFIEGGDKQSTYRVQAKLGYKFSDRSLINIYGLQSNIASAVASANATSFTFTEFGLRFKWILFRDPIFKNRKVME